MKPYPKYKESGISWLGEVPVSWELKRLKFLTSCNSDTLSESADPDKEISYIDISSVVYPHGIQNIEKMLFSDAPSRARRLVKKGDTIVSTVRTYLKAIATIEGDDEDLVVSTGFAVIRPRSLFPQYLSRLITSHYMVETIASISVGVSYPAVNASDIGSIVVPRPPMDEQQSIASFLDKETARIDALIQKKERMIELLKEKRIALITQAVTKGLDPNVPMKGSGIEWLGEVPKHWEICKAGNGYSIQLGKMLQPEQASDSDILIPYLKAINVQWNRISNDDDNQMWASPNDLNKYGVRKGDLLVCEGGEVGRSAILLDDIGDYIIQNALHRVRSVLNNVVFLKYILQVAANEGWFDILCNKATIAHFTREKFSELMIPYPPLLEQYAIVSYLHLKLHESQLLLEKITQSITLLQEYRSSLIHHAVTGKIDLRGYDVQA